MRHCLWTGPCGGKGDDIAAFLLDVVSRFKLKLEKNVCMTTDTAKAERAGTHLAKMFRNDCGDHWLNLVLKLLVDEGKPAKGNKVERLPSPVLGSVKKMIDFGKKLRNAPVLLMEFHKQNNLYKENFGLDTVFAEPTVPPETRWGFLDEALRSILPARSVVDSTIAARPEYGLKRFNDDDWIILEQVLFLICKYSFLPFFSLPRLQDHSRS